MQCKRPVAAPAETHRKSRCRIIHRTCTRRLTFDRPPAARKLLAPGGVAASRLVVAVAAGHVMVLVSLPSPRRLE